VTLSNISLEQYNGDAELQEFLRTDLAESAANSATLDDVTLMGARIEDSGTRRLLEQLLLVDYKIVFASVADAETAKGNLVAADSLPNTETHGQATYTGFEVDFLGAIDVSPAAPTDSPTESPTDSPTLAPSESPTPVPSEAPTVTPTATPTVAPTTKPTETPTNAPTTTPPTAGT
jgi:hypothetical protein